MENEKIVTRVNTVWLDEAARVACAVALIGESPVSKVPGNFYLGLSSPNLPTRLFSSGKEALLWQQGYLE